MSQSYMKLVGAVAVRWRALLRCNVVRSGMLQSYTELVGTDTVSWRAQLQCVEVEGPVAV